MSSLRGVGSSVAATAPRPRSGPPVVGMNPVAYKLLRFCGKSLQVADLLTLPLAMSMQMTDTLGRSLHVSQMVFMAIFGVCMFGIGAILANAGQE